MILTDHTYLDEYEHRLQQNGFVYGGGLLAPDQQHFYVNIPKNASSYLEQVFVDNGWTVNNLMDLVQQQTVYPIIFVRDPVERWISGCAQYLIGIKNFNQPIMELYNPLIEGLLFDKVVFDDHTMPQYYFFHKAGISMDNVRCFRLDGNYKEKIYNRLLVNFYDNYPDHVYNRSVDHSEKQSLIVALTEKLNQNSTLKEKIKQRYATDYWLLEHYAI